MKVTFLLWDGVIGGAERMSVELAAEFRRQGVQSSVVFVGSEKQLGAQLDRERMPRTSLGFRRGSMVIRHPRLLAKELGRHRADAAIVVSVGYLGAALRVGGFRGVIIGVEHGTLLRISGLPPVKRIVRRVDRMSGVFPYDAEVAVSRYLAAEVRKSCHTRRLVCIPHGVRVPLEARPSVRSGEGQAHMTLGFAGRLIPGKGVDALLRAIAVVRHNGSPRRDARLRVAGGGPEEGPLQALALHLGIANAVEFVGWTDDVPGFWESCDVAVAPNDCVRESFCLSVAEAMAWQRPAIVTNLGALPEVVTAGASGLMVRPGDINELAQAICTYFDDRHLLLAHGRAAYARAASEFTMDRCSKSYLELVETLHAERARSAD